MKVLEIPFNKFLGLESANNDDNYIFKLEPKDEYMNHLGTIHASAMFALAEASSGEYLLNQFKDFQLDIIPVVRKVEIKYSKPANGVISSRANIIDSDIHLTINELKDKGRVIIKVKVDLFNKDAEKLFTSIFDWFITNRY
ncbi:PaaI family thioesterase [Saccharicrinis sp. FJH2]|uniref:PaaI family thioesterase n=1 Tax=Saccharicrinis sp. FJH65 TaxID=3344659 RepID=UPI0035F41318